MLSKRVYKREQLLDLCGEALLFADGFDEAILGAGRQCGGEYIVVYSYWKCVAILMKRDGMTSEEAMEYMDSNVINAYVGNRTPFFITEEV